jgi:hypothetical protein
MNTKDLIRLGVPSGAPLKLGMEFILNFIATGGDPARLEEEVAAIIANPAPFLADPAREAFARAHSMRPHSSSARRSPHGASGAPASSPRP